MKIGHKFSSRSGLQKLVEVNALQGNRGLQDQQASTRVIYDTLTFVANQSYYRFFDNVSSRTFPNTNLSENKLQVNESMIIKWINFHVYVTTATGSGVVGSQPLSAIGLAYYRADYWIEVANSMILKNTPVETQAPAFNRHAAHTSMESAMLESNLTIPSLLEFVVTLRTNTTALPATATALSYVCQMEGLATIYKPNSRF